MNHLQKAVSPYLLQHAENPVDWYPWCQEAFDKAQKEQKPIFLSIGYSTCHWCHVMARECFSDQQVADALNADFVSIKVDKEERPDVDEVYMAACQAMTGSGGWPTSIFMTPQKLPFFAGTYFPKHTGPYGMGFLELLAAVSRQWQQDRQALEQQGQALVRQLAREQESAGQEAAGGPDSVQQALSRAKASFDAQFGGFGPPPKFPMGHLLCFLLEVHRLQGDSQALEMAETTLGQLQRGGIFDHIGYGYCRYSTDRQFLVPHFEKMLYDNALLILANAKAYAVTKKEWYRQAAEQTAQYVLEEMTSPGGGFYSAQDADAQGKEGGFYLLTPQQVEKALEPEQAAAFCRAYDVTQRGHMPGGSIPNLLQNPYWDRPWKQAGVSRQTLEQARQALKQYRRQRLALHLDDKILTGWNGLMILAMTALYRQTKEPRYLQAAQNAKRQIVEQLYQDGRLYVGLRGRRRSGEGFLDDYGWFALALLGLHQATLCRRDLELAAQLTEKAIELFYDEKDGGFFTTARDQETLPLRSKQVYDGAMPCGNSVMAYLLVRLWQVTGHERFHALAQAQLAFLERRGKEGAFGRSFSLTAKLQYEGPAPLITVVLARPEDRQAALEQLPPDAVVRVLEEPSEAYPLRNGQLTFYVCQDRSCKPPVNRLA